MEKLIIEVRKELSQTILGEHGAAAIREELLTRSIGGVPSLRTVGRVLERHGLLDGRARVRRPAPPKGWYLPAVAAGQADIDSVDAIEQLSLKGGPLIDVLTATSVLGRLPGAWPTESGITAKFVVESLIEHWRAFGLPAYVQFDNATCFQGPHHYQDVMSRVIRLCLSLEVSPVFVIPGEYGFQAGIENFNGLWQRRVWSRFHHHSPGDLGEKSRQYIEALRRRHAATIDSAPPRRDFPGGWSLDLQRQPSGRIIYLRRCTDKGSVSLLGRTFHVDANWPGRIVRCEVDLDGHSIQFFALRRRDPRRQPLLKMLPFHIKRRSFHG